jgi:hypothetical protein
LQFFVVFLYAVEHQYGGKELSPFQGENCEYLMTPCTAMAHMAGFDIPSIKMGKSWNKTWDKRDNSRIDGGLNGRHSSC